MSSKILKYKSELGEKYIHRKADLICKCPKQCIKEDECSCSFFLLQSKLQFLAAKTLYCHEYLSSFPLRDVQSRLWIQKSVYSF